MQYPGFMQAFLSFAQSPAFAGVENFCCRVYPWIAAILMAAVLLWYLPRYFYEGYSGRYFARTHRDEPREDIRFMAFGSRPLRAALWVLMMFAASRALWLIILQIVISANGLAPLSLDSLPGYLNKWDAVNYTRIAQYWYGFDNHGIPDYVQEYTIAFLPGYPVMIRALNCLVGDYVLSGMILSNVMALGSGVLLYAMVSDMYSEPAARRCCFFFFFSIAACVFSATHSESALVFFTLLSVYLARKRHFVPAVIVGAYAAFTRQFGMFAAVPVFYEILRSLERYPTSSDIIMREREDVGAVVSRATLGERVRHSVRMRKVWPYVALTACILLGYVAYMIVNYAVYGTPTAFLYYQQLNWGNQLTSMWNCVRIIAENLCGNLRAGSNASSVMGIFLPEFVMALALPLVLLAFVRRGDAGDNAYAWCYVALSFSSTWLISGIRYIAAMYPLYIMMALLSSRRGWRWVLYTLTFVLFAYYNVMYSAYALVV